MSFQFIGSCNRRQCEKQQVINSIELQAIYCFNCRLSISNNEGKRERERERGMHQGDRTMSGTNVVIGPEKFQSESTKSVGHPSTTFVLSEVVILQ
jgi:hypothetical protein